MLILLEWIYQRHSGKQRKLSFRLFLGTECMISHSLLANDEACMQQVATSALFSLFQGAYQLVHVVDGRETAK